VAGLIPASFNQGGGALALIRRGWYPTDNVPLGSSSQRVRPDLGLPRFGQPEPVIRP
jgi:hypothetical protein